MGGFLRFNGRLGMRKRIRVMVFVLTAAAAVWAAPVLALASDGEYDGGANPWGYAAAGFAVGGIGLAAGVVTMEYKKHRPVRTATNADAYVNAGEASMDVETDTFLRTNTTRTKVASSAASSKSGGAKPGGARR